MEVEALATLSRGYLGTIEALEAQLRGAQAGTNGAMEITEDHEAEGTEWADKTNNEPNEPNEPCNEPKEQHATGADEGCELRERGGVTPESPPRAARTPAQAARAATGTEQRTDTGQTPSFAAHWANYEERLFTAEGSRAKAPGRTERRASASDAGAAAAKEIAAANEAAAAVAAREAAATKEAVSRGLLRRAAAAKEVAMAKEAGAAEAGAAAAKEEAAALAAALLRATGETEAASAELVQLTAAAAAAAASAESERQRLSGELDEVRTQLAAEVRARAAERAAAAETLIFERCAREAEHDLSDAEELEAVEPRGSPPPPPPPAAALASTAGTASALARASLHRSLNSELSTTSAQLPHVDHVEVTVVAAPSAPEAAATLVAPTPGGRKLSKKTTNFWERAGEREARHRRQPSGGSATDPSAMNNTIVALQS